MTTISSPFLHFLISPFPISSFPVPLFINTPGPGEPGKTYHVRNVRWNQLPYMVQQRVGWLERRISHRKFEFFDLNVTISYESASGGPSVPSLRVENCDLHGNSIVPTSKSVPPGRRVIVPYIYGSWFHLTSRT